MRETSFHTELSIVLNFFLILIQSEFTEKMLKKYLSYLLSHLSFSIRNSRSPKIYQIFFLKLKIFFPSLQKVNFKCKNAVPLVSEAKNNFIYDNVQGFLIFFKRVKMGTKKAWSISEEKGLLSIQVFFYLAKNVNEA